MRGCAELQFISHHRKNPLGKATVIPCTHSRVRVDPCRCEGQRARARRVCCDSTTCCAGSRESVTGTGEDSERRLTKIYKQICGRQRHVRARQRELTITTGGHPATRKEPTESPADPRRPAGEKRKVEKRPQQKTKPKAQPHGIIVFSLTPLSTIPAMLSSYLSLAGYIPSQSQLASVSFCGPVPVAFEFDTSCQHRKMLSGPRREGDISRNRRDRGVGGQTYQRSPSELAVVAGAFTAPLLRSRITVAYPFPSCPSVVSGVRCRSRDFLVPRHVCACF